MKQLTYLILFCTVVLASWYVDLIMGGDSDEADCPSEYYNYEYEGSSLGSDEYGSDYEDHSDSSSSEKDSDSSSSEEDSDSSCSEEDTTPVPTTTTTTTTPAPTTTSTTTTPAPTTTPTTTPAPTTTTPTYVGNCVDNRFFCLRDCISGQYEERPKYYCDIAGTKCCEEIEDNPFPF